MLRYIGFAWNAAEAGAVESATLLNTKLEQLLPDLARAYVTPGLTVYCKPARTSAMGAHSVGQRTGVVLGKLFSRQLDADFFPPVTRFDEAESTRILHGGGRRLVQDYWGQYIAFLHDAPSASSFVIRDPTGSLPCYFTSYRDVTIFFSHLQDCVALGVNDFSVNWQYVTARMIMQLVEVNETGLKEVSQLAPGECRIVQARRPPRTELYWDPVRIAASDPIEDLEIAAAEARKTVLACVSSWAASYPHIVQRLSGGLDSSILLACLRQARSRPDLTCVHHFERSVWGDERRFARLALESAGQSNALSCELLETERRPEDVALRAAMNVAPTPSPGRYMTSHELRRLDVPVANRQQAAVFTGTHGDGVFFTKRQFSATDYFHRHGFGRHLMRITHATALVEGIAVWKLLPEAIREGWRARHEPYAFSNDMSRRAQSCQFIAAPALDNFLRSSERYFVPPWLDAADRLAPGKLCHLKILAVPKSIANPFEHPEDPDWIMPFASQPVLELFARIPSYVLTAGGQNRAVARRAFASELPPEIFWRHSKAFGNHFLLTVFQRNVSLYREMLLEGVLVREGLLDKRKVEEFFATARDAGARGLVELLQTHFNVETWLREWASAGHGTARAAAA